MALIGTLRNRMGTWVVVFVFVAISAFVLNDLLGNSSVLLGRNTVAEIGGTTISLSEFQDAIKEMESNYVLNLNREPGEREMITLRQQAWDRLVAKYTIEKEYNKVGITVTTEEVVDMISGNNVDQNIQSAFQNPTTGEFDRSRLAAYVQQINGSPPTDPQQRAMWEEQRYRWESFQRDLAPGRERIKYENLLIRTNYITSAEGQREYHVQTDVGEVKYLYVPYFSISDTAINVTDADLNSYYNKNKEHYKTEPTKDISYIRFPVTPSAADSAAVREDMQTLKTEFAEAQNDSAFAVINSDAQPAFDGYNLQSMPDFVDQDSLIVGKIAGPFIDEDALKIYKTVAIEHDTAAIARASHILVKWDDDTPAAKAEAKREARQILSDIRAGADFAAKAREFGTDASSSRGGDLGWIAEGDMVKPFENAVFGATRSGLLNDVVETQFGYHVIDVTHVKDDRIFKIAVIARDILPSDETINEALRSAELFASGLTTSDAFSAKADEEGLQLLNAANIKGQDRNVGLLGDARRLVQWLFRDAKVGDVSEVFDLEDEYVVATVTAEVDEDYRPMRAVRDQIMPAVKNEIKGRRINEKLGTLKGTLEEMAQSFGSDAHVYTMSDLKLSTNSLQGINFDPRSVGLAFSLDDGQRSGLFSGESGVVLMEMIHKTLAPEIADYSYYENQLRQRKSVNATSYNIVEAIKDQSGIEDYRYRFY